MERERRYERGVHVFMTGSISWGVFLGWFATGWRREGGIGAQERRVIRTHKTDMIELQRALICRTRTDTASVCTSNGMFARGKKNVGFSYHNRSSCYILHPSLLVCVCCRSSASPLTDGMELLTFLKYHFSGALLSELRREAAHTGSLSLSLPLSLSLSFSPSFQLKWRWGVLCSGASVPRISPPRSLTLLTEENHFHRWHGDTFPTINSLAWASFNLCIFSCWAKTGLVSVVVRCKRKDVRF